MGASKTLPPNAIIVDLPSGRATIPFSNFLNSLTQNVNGAAAGTVTTALGSGLAGGGIVADGISLTIAANGVSNAMIRQSAAYSVIGRAFGSAGNVADITATADDRILARIGGVLAFWDLAVVPATVADGDYGDITVSGTGAVWTIDANVVTNAKLAQVPTATFKGRTTAATGNAEDLTVTQATALLNAFSSTLKGLAPASGGGTANYLRADGTWATPPGATSGTVTTVSVVTANGVSGSVANPTTTPAITLTLAAITPTTIDASDRVRVTGNATTPGAGVGLELFYNAAGSTSGLISYDRGGSAYKAMNIDGLTVTFRASGTDITVVSSTGLATTGAVSATTYLKSGVYTVGTLPAAATAGAGARACVTDALAPVFLGIIVGGGAIFTGVICDGANWRAD